jgi:hypothetical protein
VNVSTDNYFMGAFPNVINFANLQLLDVSANQLDGPGMPLPRSLVTMKCAGNRLNGSIDFVVPSVISSNTILTTIDMYVILLFLDCSPFVDDWVGNNTNSSANQFSGSIPATFSRQNGLLYFNAASNQLSGAIPSPLPSGSRWLLKFNRFTLPLPIAERALEFDVSNNGIEGDIETIIAQLFLPPAASSVPPTLQSLDLSHNNIGGKFVRPFAAYSLVILKLSDNPIGGTLSKVHFAIPKISELDITNTKFDGPLPDAFKFLNELWMEGTFMSDPNGRVPSWLNEAGQRTASVGYTCPTFWLGANGNIAISPEYYNHSLCTCSEGYYGIGKNCQLCSRAHGCKCSGTRIRGCFPTRTALLPCLISAGGKTPCNPNATSTITGLYVDIDPITGELGGPGHANLTQFCAEGYIGRLCSQCRRGYFQRGYDCIPCPEEFTWVSVFIWVAMMGLFSVYTYQRTPTVPPSHSAPPGLLRHQQDREERKLGKSVNHSPSHSASSRTLLTLRSAAVSPVLGPMGMGAPSIPVAHLPPSHSMNNMHAGSVIGATPPPLVRQSSAEVNDIFTSAPPPTLRTKSTNSAVEPAEAKNEIGFGEGPFKAYSHLPGSAVDSILIFHCQGLGVILVTQSSLPNTILNFLSYTSSASSFQFNQVAPLECYNHNFGLSHNLWLSLAMPLVLLATICGFYIGSRVSRALPQRKHLFRRFLAVGAGLVNAMYLPSAQTALSALGCTDTRQEGSATFLNLYPWQPCDDEWHRTMLIPASMGAILALVVFPLFLVVGLVYARKRLARDTTVTVAGALIAAYRPRFFWWECVRVLRRLALVLLIAFVPYHSIYLSLGFFITIQLSALLQHHYRPYARVFDNRAEVASLYLLLLNFFTGLMVAQRESSLGDEANGSGGSSTVKFDEITDEQTRTDGQYFIVLLTFINVAFIGILIIKLLAPYADNCKKRMVESRQQGGCCTRRGFAACLPSCLVTICCNGICAPCCGSRQYGDLHEPLFEDLYGHGIDGLTTSINSKNADRRGSGVGGGSGGGSPVSGSRNGSGGNIGIRGPSSHHVVVHSSSSIAGTATVDGSNVSSRRHSPLSQSVEASDFIQATPFLPDIVGPLPVVSTSSGLMQRTRSLPRTTSSNSRHGDTRGSVELEVGGSHSGGLGSHELTTTPHMTLLEAMASTNSAAAAATGAGSSSSSSAPRCPADDTSFVMV